MKRMVAVQTRLKLSFELKDYLDDYIVFYNQIQRRVFQDFKHGIPQEMGMSRYITYICNMYGVLKRTANAIRYDMRGRIKAYMQLKKTELKQLEIKIQSVQKKVRKLEIIVNKLKPLAALNQLDEIALQEYRNTKASLYYRKNRLNKLKQRKDVLKQQIKDKKISLCFGTKKLFDVQNRLAENGYRSHEKWLHDFQRKRDSGIFFLGSGDESYGNQILQLKPNDNGFQMQLIKDKPFRDESKYIQISGIRFFYMVDELVYAIMNHQPITYHIARKGRKWYLAAIFSIDVDISTNDRNGVIGIDYNDGFMEMVETNVSGNMVRAEHIKLEQHGTGNKAESEIKEKLSKLVRYARDVGKDIVVEDLDFKKKKAEQQKGNGKNYNRMLHLFDYHRYLFWLENLCIKYGVKLMKVNPAYTSRIGKQKYSNSRKLTVHRAAAFVIARKGQGFEDKLVS